MKINKKIFTVAISAFILFLACTNVNNIQVKASEVDGITYEVKEVKGSSDSIKIVGIKIPDGKAEISIPEKIDGKNVVSINLDSTDAVSPYQETAKIPVKKISLPKTIKKSLSESETYAEDDEIISLTNAFTKLEDIEVDSKNKELESKNGILYDEKLQTLLIYPREKKNKTYKMPKTVIKNYSISNYYLETLTMSSNKKYVDAHGVNSCQNLKKLIFPSNIKEVSGFSWCPSLCNIKWGKIEQIDCEAFNYCDSLKKIKFPYSLKIIDEDAFKYCHNIKSIELQKNVMKIESGAFSHSKKMKIKKTKYLKSVKNKKIANYYKNEENRFEKYVSVFKVKRGKKVKYYPYWMMEKLEANKVNSLGKKQKKKLKIYSYIQENEKSSSRKKCFVYADYLRFTSSNKKVVSVSKKGILTRKKKGKVKITIQLISNHDDYLKLEIKK